ncbi:hypothetical protein GCM10009069_29450 [Algimonas arctica]|uniref:Uncharacterized protein n=2 Tax=Algimonas arctica TaxID=1479486 RepID=A0A8J3CSX2_9PROT|nr:hypothetical protein GCM10009069_29450 [Algimonas arctica]
MPILVIAFLAFGLGAVGYVQHEQQSPSHSADNGPEQSVERSSPEAPLSQSEQAPSAHQGISKDEWERRDHQAQIGMFKASVAAVVLTVIGLGLVGCTVYYTKEAARAANKTLKLAKKTLTESRKANAAEIRPYLTFKSIELDPHGDWIKDGRLSYNIDCVVENIGRFPAREISFFASHSRDALFSRENELSKICGHLSAGGDTSYELSTGSGVDVRVDEESGAVTVIKHLEIKDGYRTEIYAGVRYSGFSGESVFETVATFDVHVRIGPDGTIYGPIRNRRKDEAT